MKRSLAYFSVATLSIIAFVSLTGFFGDKKTSTLKPNNLWVELDQSQADSPKINIPSLSPLVRKVEGAVLLVTTEAVVKGSAGPFRGFDGDPFEFFFGPQGRGQRQRPERKAQGQGSGFIIHPSGYALTNNHVIENATSIKVRVGGEIKEYSAEIVGADEDNDIALIMIKSDRKDWPVIPLGSSAKAQVGDYAVAIGNPLGLELSVSSGIISARGRRDVQPSGRSGLFDFFQIDAPINPGNSGGPLLNLSGEAIGINTAMAQGQGIGFAIPIDQVKQIVTQLKENGKATRSWLGVEIQPVSEGLAKELGLSGRQGAVIRQVVANSPASKAGIEPGDVVIEFDGEVIREPGSLQLKAGLTAPGKSVPVKVLRNGKSIMVTVKLEERPSDGKGKKSPTPASQGDIIRIESIGLSVTNSSTPEIQGARIVQVEPSSNAGFAGLEPDDVIFKLNNASIKSAKELSDAVERLKSGSVLQILLKRGSMTLFVAIQKD